MKFSCKYITVFIISTSLILLTGCNSGKDDLGDGFKRSETTTTKTTLPSKTPNIGQPCSLLSVDQAANILGVLNTKLGTPESSEPEKNVLRCRYGTLSDDNKLYLVLNIYIYKSQSSFTAVKKNNKATQIQTNVDEGFYFDKTSTKQSERFVAARKGEIRIAVSSSIATVDPKQDLTKEQIQLPGIDILANVLGTVIGKLNK